MKQVLILGAHGKIAQRVTKNLLAQDVHQKLFLRNSARLSIDDPVKESLIEGNATSLFDLEQALTGVDIVYANLAGKIVEEAQNLVAAMKAKKVKRLIWISTLGIYDEVPGNYGKWNHEQLDGGYLEAYSKAARVIEDSGLDYTIIRPAWLTDQEEVDYELTKKGEVFKGTEVSRKSIADLVTKIIDTPNSFVGDSLGVNKPNTDGDKPAWYR
ncbi:SDR family oxidoreductase [Enterococcus malodoratus]|uniref:NAD(P)-binding domain-containing protein n=1 Tax=Enterococcus malodoratus ATCC 43197 TaxID=1158601 RepID=R2QTE8_9ENTE|nr:SDR family oxidoreductase [Enterococcus malodoratus]EOH71896.1 hypothetical protein UAI_04180 [Enterococcus malodoratus ATCC 43197]EOT70080.1 hypothetical protein I585_01559 [Enterococcus malodoratus ATCC 43197]OJG66283.1 hypothetical protein RV07_GL000076 [Enterococcus malodoratus]SPW74797.1 Putative NADH-flavin reductase [Enterococcus malodoratus]STD65291.1 Putative NADH-flavin reductase [Enterococcus malodoratus]